MQHQARIQKSYRDDVLRNLNAFVPEHKRKNTHDHQRALEKEKTEAEEEQQEKEKEAAAARLAVKKTVVNEDEQQKIVNNQDSGNVPAEDEQN